ncbi:head-tail joining protein [Comamonas thiooxydans]|uniref:head-tail joining protein n=1 Tax=Comamonas thiooxydans TaxID=363952 RepID=UPI000699C444|nr:hypothetical protein [Comamonas thiooxydans]
MQPFNPQAHASLAPFAGVEQLINTSVLGVLANATATWLGGMPFAVIFDSKPHDGLGVGQFEPSCSLPVASAPGLEEGGVLVINGQEWEVIEPVVADSSGWATVLLRRGSNG